MFPYWLPTVAPKQNLLYIYGNILCLCPWQNEFFLSGLIFFDIMLLVMYSFYSNKTEG